MADETRAARHARIIANLTRPIPAPYRPPPARRATFLKLRPGDEVRAINDPDGAPWRVVECFSDGMQLLRGTQMWRWEGPWEDHFTKVPRRRGGSKKKVGPHPNDPIDNSNRGVA